MELRMRVAHAIILSLALPYGSGLGSQPAPQRPAISLLGPSAHSAEETWEESYAELSQFCADRLRPPIECDRTVESWGLRFSEWAPKRVADTLRIRIRG